MGQLNFITLVSGSLFYAFYYLGHSFKIQIFKYMFTYNLLKKGAIKH